MGGAGSPDRATPMYGHTAADDTTARRLYDDVATLSGYLRYDVGLQDTDTDTDKDTDAEGEGRG